MALGLLIVVCIIGILLGVAIYIYENSVFYKMTNYSYLKLWTDRDARNTYKLTKSLGNINGEHKLLLNVKIPVGNKQKLIDAILLHESGIYILSIYYMDGWIYGREQDDQWTQALHKGKYNKFDNPIIHNKIEIAQLSEMLPQMDDTFFSTLIVFGDECSFNKVETHSLDVDVIKMNELKSYWSEPIGANLSKEEIEACYNELEKLMDFTIQHKKPQNKNVTAD